jgi:hypothetical protein
MPSCGVIVYLHAQQTPELVAAAAWRCNRATLLPRTCLFQVREQTGTHTSHEQIPVRNGCSNRGAPLPAAPRWPGPARLLPVRVCLLQLGLRACSS